MRRFALVLLPALALGCASAGAFGGTAAPRGKLFIIGGGARPPALIDRLVDEAGLRYAGYAVVLPMASAEPDSAIIWSSEAFLARDVQVVGFHFAPGTVASAARLDSLQRASLIYLAGGDQVRFMEAIEGTPIADAIRAAHHAGAVVAGTSAGAAVMGGQMLTGDQRRHPDYTSTYEVLEADNLNLEPGLRLLEDVVVDQHFVARSRHNRLLTVVMELPDVLGIGIDESTALLVEGDRAEVVGEAQVLVFRNPERSSLRQGGLLGARGLRLDVYLPGDTFRLR